MSKQTELVGLARTTKLDEVNAAYDAGALSNRNMVINGAMNVAQRATSATGLGAASGYFTLDRFQMSTDTGGSATAGRYTMTQTADGPNGVSANCLKLDCTTADTSIAAGELLAIVHKFEGQNLQRIGKGVAGAKELTVSFYVKGSATANYMLELKDTDHGRISSKLFAVTTDWNRIEVVVPADVDDGSSPFNDDNATSLELRIWLHAGSNYTSGTASSVWANQTSADRAVGISSFFSNTANNFFITGVQMEVGPVATEFEHRSYGDELARCQRYFFKLEGDLNDRCGIGGYVVSSGEARFDFLMPVSMRAVPTLSGSGLALIDAATDSADFTITDMVVNSPPTGTITGLGLQIATSGMVAGQAGGLRFKSAGSNLTLEAEL